MIKYRLLITLVCLCMFCTVGIGSGKTDALEGDGLTLTYDNVMKVDVNAGGPSYLEHQKYNYSTSLRKEIAYILNYINNFHLEDDGTILNANDVSSYSVKIYMIDGSVKKCGFYAGRFYDGSDKQYAIDSNECNRFLDFIYALKTKKIVLDDEVTFETSEWAKAEVTEAIEADLVPAWNQINYQGKITRLEVCQLISNYLEIEGITEQLEISPFSDTADPSVTMLYQLNIIDGKTETLFCPYDYITREEFAKILYNAHQVINKDSLIKEEIVYNDDADISTWAKESIYGLTQLGIFKGNNNNDFSPKENTTKEQVIATILRTRHV